MTFDEFVAQIEKQFSKALLSKDEFTGELIVHTGLRVDEDGYIQFLDPALG